MDNITIGIPRGLLYYKYKYLWTTFFKELDVNILISPWTNSKIINDGKKINNKICPFVQIYFGHIKYLIDNNVDYVLIFRINKEDECYYYNALYDIVQNVFDIKLLDFNIDSKTSEEDAFINIGKKLGFCMQSILNAYSCAKKEDYKQRKINYLLQQKKVTSKKEKILLISKNYINEDQYIKNNLLKNKNAEIFSSEIQNFDKKTLKKDYFLNFKQLENVLNKTLYITTSSCVSKKEDLYEKNDKIFINLDDMENKNE